MPCLADCVSFGFQEAAKLHSGQLSDVVVVKDYISSFVEGASYFLDTQAMMDANTTFWSTLYFDERRASSTTRTHGILPNCNRCSDGNFTDFLTGRSVRNSHC